MKKSNHYRESNPRPSGSTLRIIPKEGGPHLHRGGSLKLPKVANYFLIKFH